MRYRKFQYEVWHPGVLSRDDGGRADVALRRCTEDVQQSILLSSVFSSEDLESMPEVEGGRAGQ